VSDDHKGLVTVHPLVDWSALETYRFPDATQVGDFSRVIETVKANPGRKYLLVDGDTLFQRMFYLRGSRTSWSIWLSGPLRCSTCATGSWSSSLSGSRSGWDTAWTACSFATTGGRRRA